MTDAELAAGEAAWRDFEDVFFGGQFFAVKADAGEDHREGKTHGHKDGRGKAKGRIPGEGAKAATAKKTTSKKAANERGGATASAASRSPMPPDGRLPSQG